MKISPIRGLAVAVIAVAAAGCSGGSTPPPATTMAAQPATTAPPAGTATAAASSDFGVPACDSYMRKYVACVDSKVPEQARTMMRQSLDQTKMAWTQAASTPQGRDGLAAACVQAEAAAKQAMAAYGCTW